MKIFFFSKKTKKNKAPEPVEPWKPKVLDALRHANTCIRSDTFSIDKGPLGEDCLALNIFVPGDKRFI